MVPESLFTAFRGKSLEIDCTDITLKQSGSLTRPIEYRGKGVIYQSQEDILHFKIYADRTTNTNRAVALRDSLNIKSGRLYEESDFYELKAISISGQIRTAIRILPLLRWGSAENPIITGKLDAIVAKQKALEAAPWLKVHFFDHLELPSMEISKIETPDVSSHVRDKTNVSAAGVDFLIRATRDEVTVRTTSQKFIPLDFHLRIQEALMFMTAQPASWRAVYENRDGINRVELCSAIRRSAATRLDPPIAPGHHGNSADTWKLFVHYLEYVVANTSGNHWNQLTYHLHNACEASANSVDAWAIGLSVAVEGVASLIPFKNTREQKNLIDALQAWAQEKIKSEPKFKPLSKRLGGHIGSLANVSAKDRIMSLKATGHVAESNIAAWNKLRNRHVHPKQIDLQNIASRNFQAVLDQINQTTVLLYQVAFYIIGYAGPYTDYGCYGFPTKRYPLAPENGSPTSLPE